MSQPQQKVLIVYASQFGSTAGVADAIGEILQNSTVKTDVQRVEDVQSVVGYDAVIIGSAIQYDKWMEPATLFVQTHRKALEKRPVSLFFTCLTLSRRDQKSIEQAGGYANALSADFPKVPVSQIGQFAGVLNYSKFPMYARPFAHILFGILGVKAGDHRNWANIRQWARQTAVQMKLHHPDYDSAP